MSGVGKAFWMEGGISPHWSGFLSLSVGFRSKMIVCKRGKVGREKERRGRGKGIDLWREGWKVGRR